MNRHRTTRRSAPAVTVYRANQRHDLAFFETWAVMARNVWNWRGLIWQLFKRDFTASYKRSFLGFTWAFLAPILGVVSWVFLQMTGMLKPGDTGIPYPAFVLIGSSMWGLFMGFYGSAAQTLNTGKDLVLQVNYPHEALLFKQTAQHLSNFLITFVMNVIVLFAFRVVPSWGILLFPLVALPLFFLGAAIGLMVSMISVVAVDMSWALNTGMGLLMWVTPVIYTSSDKGPFVQAVNKWNPLTYLVCSCRDIIIDGRLYDARGYAICAVASFLAFMISWRLFYVSEHKLVERMI